MAWPVRPVEPSSTSVWPRVISSVMTPTPTDSTKRAVPSAVLADPSRFTLPERGDRAYAVLTSVAAAVAAEPTVDRWVAGWRVMARAGESAPDVAAMAARILARCRPEGAAAPPEARAFLPLLHDAGLL